MTTFKRQKSLKLRAFVIENNELSKADSGLLLMMENKLKTSIAKERRMLLNPDDPNNEEDLISDYSIRQGVRVTGAMLRIMASSDLPNIPDELFDEKTINITKLDKLEVGASSVYKDHYYFLLNKKYLVTNLPGNTTITKFQTYINWYLENERKSTLFEFTPLIELKNQIMVSELKSIRIQDSSRFPTQQDEVNQKITKISLDFLLDLLNDVKGLKDIQLDRVISAELLIKFKKPKQMNKEEYQKILGAYMKPISDTDNVVFMPKKGRPIKGTQILKEKVVSVEITESGKISEPQLFQEMEMFLTDIDDEKRD